MKRRLCLLLTMVMLLLSLNVMPVYASGNYVTSYAFADIAGSVSGNTINVTVPYRTVCTYWNHKVQVSDGAYFSTGALNRIDDQHYQGQLTVTGDDGQSNIYTVNIRKDNYKGPEYELGKAKSIRKNSVKIPVNIKLNDANVTSIRVTYYTKKNSTSYVTVPSTNGDIDVDVEINGLREDRKYYYYLSVVTPEKTYETSSKSFTTKKSTDTTTSSSSSNNTNKTTSTTPAKGTNASGPGTDAKQDTVTRNEWKIVDGKWYYFGEDGFSKTGWFQVGDKWYYVTKGTNDLAMGCWKEISGVWYFFDASGAMIANNWVQSNGAWYWMGPSGSMLTSQEIDVGGRRYMLGPDGVCFDNKMIMKDGRWQYYKAGAQGLAVNEVFEYNGSTYRADANGFLY